MSNSLVKEDIFVTAEESFPCSYRDIFSDTKITHYSGKESMDWLSSPKIWPQQLNFAIFCGTTVCGISSHLLVEDKTIDGSIDVTDNELHLPSQVRSFLRFMYFTV